MDKFYIGIDFGGTCIRVVSCDYRGHDLSQILKRVIVRKDTAMEELEENLIPLIEQICEEKSKEGKRLEGIGIAMAALFDRETGVIEGWPNNRKYQNFPMKRYLEERYGVSVLLEDDANAAALGEQLAGEGKGFSDLLYVTISTGIGCGIIMHDSLLTGCHGWAGELGHIKVTEDEVLCTCGAKGCLQAVASGPAIFRDIKQTGFFERYGRKSQLTLKECVHYARQGNQELLDLFQKKGNCIGKALANLVILLDIPVIILGGGVVEAGDILLEPIRDAAEEGLAGRRAVKIVRSKLNDKNGALGALNLIQRAKCND